MIQMDALPSLFVCFVDSKAFHTMRKLIEMSMGTTVLGANI